jgi:hypothetical protein
MAIGSSESGSGPVDIRQTRVELRDVRGSS